MEWLYPELKRTNPKDRSSALQEAKASSLDAIELVGIGIALVLAVVVTRYSATGLVALGRIGAAFWNFMVAIPVLLVFAGPLYVRRVREAFANSLKNVRGLKQIKLDRDMISASDSSKVHRPTAAMQSNAVAAIGGGFNRSLQHRPESIGRRFKPQGFPGALV